MTKPQKTQILCMGGTTALINGDENWQSKIPINFQCDFENFKTSIFGTLCYVLYVDLVENLQLTECNFHNLDVFIQKFKASKSFVNYSLRLFVYYL